MEFDQISTACESTISPTINSDLEPLPAKKQKVIVLLYLLKCIVQYLTLLTFSNVIQQIELITPPNSLYSKISKNILLLIIPNNIYIKSKYHLVTDRCNSKTTQCTNLKFGIEVLLIFSRRNEKNFSKMFRFSGVINNYNYSSPIRIFLHGTGSWRPSGFQLVATYNLSFLCEGQQ